MTLRRSDLIERRDRPGRWQIVAVDWRNGLARVQRTGTNLEEWIPFRRIRAIVVRPPQSNGVGQR